MKERPLILVRGGGDLATGVVHRLWSAGLRVLVLESEHPAAHPPVRSLCVRLSMPDRPRWRGCGQCASTAWRRLRRCGSRELFRCW